MNDEKIQKILARAGLGSRRALELWIKDNRVSVNGKIAKLGDRAKVSDQIRVDGRLLQLQASVEAKTRVILYNKPEGEVCSRHDEKDRTTVFKALPKIQAGRWIGVGRLDIGTQGLLLFTNNGELAHKLMHPSQEIVREYAARVFGEVTGATIEQLKAGVMLDDGMARFNSIIDGGGEGINHWYTVTLKEGRNREVRRLWESQGLTVSRLIRTRFANIELPRHLKAGKCQALDHNQINQLQQLAGIKL